MRFRFWPFIIHGADFRLWYFIGLKSGIRIRTNLEVELKFASDECEFSPSFSRHCRWASVWHRQRSRYVAVTVARTDSALHHHLQHVRHDDSLQRDQRAQDPRTEERLRRTQPQSALHRHLDHYVFRPGSTKELCLYKERKLASRIYLSCLLFLSSVFSSFSLVRVLFPFLLLFPFLHNPLLSLLLTCQLLTTCNDTLCVVFLFRENNALCTIPNPQAEIRTRKW